MFESFIPHQEGKRVRGQPIGEAYLSYHEPAIVLALTPLQAAQGTQAAGTQLSLDLEALGVTVEEEDEPPEVQEGDRVTYMTISDNREITVTISTRTDLTQGVISYATPLAEALLGLQQGEIGVVHQRGRPEVRFRIVGIERSTATEKATS